MAEIEAAQIAQIAQQVKSIIQAESQGVGEIGIVTSLDGVVSIPALKEGDVVVEVPLELFYLEADEALKKVDEAVKKAEDTALHPTYVGEDNYVYKWNAKTQAYEKTDIYVRGEAFKISRIYTSVINMEGDTQHGLKEGDFVLINTNDVEDPDNAKIYAVGSDGKFRFVVDMSGAIGFTGKTPQLSVGTVSVGDNRSDADISMSGNGEDADGNPRYKLNFRVPTLNLSDLTEEEIALLQSPAADMIEKLEQTDETVRANESAREEAEGKRAEAELERSAAEASRKAEETLRISSEANRSYNEQQRQEAEDLRVEGESLRREAESLREASEAARRASETGRGQAETLRAEAEAERQEAETARKESETARQEAEEARVEEFTRLKEQSEAATSDAQDTADHPTYVGEDNYVYKWNKTAQAYDKTAIYVRGESFSIKKVYASVDEMYADTATSFKEGDFCLINTGSVEDEETAQLFVRTAVGGWDFLVDMSGAIGFTGKTPQLFIGTVSVGAGKDSAAVTLSSEGTDGDGNPKYGINYIIPCLAYEDLTEEQIADLQRPASDMIARLQSTDESVKNAEAARVAAEDIRLASEQERILSEDARVAAEQERQEAEEGRREAESIRVTGENARVQAEAGRQEAETLRVESEEKRVSDEAERASNEQVRKTNEEARVAAENARAESESIRVESEDERNENESAREAGETARITAEEERAAAESVRQENEQERKTSETARKEDYTSVREGAVAATQDAVLAASQARNLPKIQGGTWWLYDLQKDAYVDTGYSVNADYQLTREKIENVFTGDISTHTHSHLIYYAQVYGELPDFSALTSWTDDEGIVHEYVAGNDIYVADTDEPTGYANYKLAHTDNGDKWVKIPQVPEGYGISLVKKD